MVSASWLLLLLPFVGAINPQANLLNISSHTQNIIGDKYTVLRHEEFPRHSVRVKQSHFCDGAVKCVREFIHSKALLIHYTTGHTQAILTSKRVIFSSTSSRADATPPKTMSYSGRTAARADRLHWGFSWRWDLAEWSIRRPRRSTRILGTKLPICSLLTNLSGPDSPTRSTESTW